MKRSKHTIFLGHLENISGKVFQEYPNIIREMIKDKAGIYALYHKNHLYNVGLTGDFSVRLGTHLKDRHMGKWDRFSIYLTITNDNLKELESLVLRIAKCKGNNVSGNFPKTVNLYRQLNSKIKKYDDDRRANILGGYVAERLRKKKAKNYKGANALENISEHGYKLIAVYKGKRYNAKLRKDGTIYYKDKIYTSPSAAGKAIIKRGCNGWKFWKYKNTRGKWVLLSSIKK